MYKWKKYIENNFIKGKKDNVGEEEFLLEVIEMINKGDEV